MYFIAYVKQKLKNHVSVFTGNCDPEDIQMKDSTNWKETQLVYPLLGFVSAKTSEQVVSFICNTTSFMRGEIAVVQEQSPASYFSINSAYLTNFEFEDGKCMNLDGVLITDLPLQSLDEASTVLGCSYYIFDLSLVFTELF
jgi:hypothetical protein